MHILLSVLLVVAATPDDAVVDDSQAAPLPPAGVAPVPASAAQPDSVTMVRASLPRTRQNPFADWMLSVEAVTHAPVDMGMLAVLETPVRVRMAFGYGWVPTSYSGLLTGIAASMSGDAQVGAILNHASYQGRTLRAQIGVRPFRSLGLYADAGYARVDIDGSLDLAGSGVPTLAGLGGGYRAHTAIDMWLVEVGSQHKFWDSMVVGLAFGLMGTTDARTGIASVNGAPSSPALGQAAKAADDALKAYGYVPTVTLRLGFDVLAVRSWLGAGDG